MLAIVFCLIIILSIPVFIWVSGIEGSVTIALFEYSFTLNFFEFSFYFLLASIVLYLFFLLFGALVYFPRFLLHLKHARQKKSSEARLKKSLDLLLTHHFAQAEKVAYQGLKSSQNPILHLVVCAVCAGFLKSQVRVKKYFLEFDLYFPNSHVLCLIKAHIANLTGFHFLAEDYLKDLKHHPAALDFLSQIYQKNEQWKKMLTILPALNQNLKDKNKAQFIENQTMHKWIDMQLEHKVSFETVWEQLDKKYKNNPDFLSRYFEFTLKDMGKHDTIEKNLQPLITEFDHVGLLRCYARLQTTHPSQTLQWYQENVKTDTVLKKQIFAKLYIRNKNYQQAQKILHQILLTDKSDAESWFLLAQVYLQTDKLEQAISCYQQFTKQKSYLSSDLNFPALIQISLIDFLFFVGVLDTTFYFHALENDFLKFD